MGSKSGGIFGSIANMEQNIRDKINPVMKVIDPIGSAVVNANNNFINKPWLELRNTPKPVAPTMLGAEPDKAGGGTATASKASSGASTGGGGAKDMATQPPNTPEGARMRFGQTTMLGVTK